jgi:epoxide hydrolase-like predicted phosphatase
MYKLILFDLGGVLFTNGTSRFINTLALRYSITEDNVKTVLDGEIGSLYRESKITRDEFWRRVIETLKLKEDSNSLEKEWVYSYELIEKTEEIIKILSSKYKVYFLSDNVKEREEALDKKYDFKALFNGGVFSYEVGFRKPDPRVYKIALEKAGEKAEETVFIDDKESSLIPARQMGITTILFETPEKLGKDLKNLGVL